MDDDYSILYSQPVASSPLFVSEDDEPAFVESETVLRRATDKEGRPFPTLCFQAPHLEHPHHHRLFCGHDIVTEKIERCGANCAVAKDKKAGGMGFDCPHPDCKTKGKVFMRQRTGRKPRKCTLSHVYGLDMDADSARMEEKRALQEANTSGNGRNLRPRPMRRGEKRSPSPPPTLNEGGWRKPGNRKKMIEVDVGEDLNREYENDPAREIVMRMTGDRARANGRFMTDKEVSDNGKMSHLTRGMSASQLATEEEQKTRKKRPLKKSAASKSGPKVSGEALREADTEPEVKSKIECDNCGEPINGERHHCFHCEDFDLCDDCFDDKTCSHPHYHVFRRLADCHAGSQTGPAVFPETFCVCETTSTSFLVLCCDCANPFHPGCIGVGKWQREWYDMGHLSRGTSMKQDYLSWTGGKVYRCRSCQKSFDEVNALTDRDLRVIERAKKRQDGAVLQEDVEEEADATVQDHTMQEEEETHERLPSPTPKLRKRSVDGDEFDSGNAQDGYTPKDKRFKFDLPVRSRC